MEYLKPDWWHRALRLGKSVDHGDRCKAQLKGKAQALFPRVEVMLTNAEALLILEAGRKLPAQCEPHGGSFAGPL